MEKSGNILENSGDVLEKSGDVSGHVICMTNFNLEMYWRNREIWRSLNLEMDWSNSLLENLTPFYYKIFLIKICTYILRHSYGGLTRLHHWYGSDRYGTYRYAISFFIRIVFFGVDQFNQ